MSSGFEFRGTVLALAALTVAGCASGGSVDTRTSGPTLSSADLSGLARTDLVGLLGPADFNRVDGPAEIMQYRGGACTLDVFLFKQSAGGETRVTHVEARDANMQTVPGDTCLNTVVQNPRPSAS